jgi:hypothetical protein
LVKDVRISTVGRAGISVGQFCAATGTSVDYLKLDNVKVIGSNTSPCTEQERGLYVDLTSSLQYLVVTGCAFDNLHYGWYLHKAVSADASTVRYVQVSDTTFNHNNLKGLYAEKLSDATFLYCTVSSNGYDAGLLSGCPNFAPWMAGFDINLKAGTYTSLTFQNSDFVQNALGGAANGVGLALKARGTGSDSAYLAFPAVLNGVNVTGCRFDGNERGVRVGEPGKANTTPTAVTMVYCSLTASVTGIGLVDELAAEAPPVAAINNWWGSETGPTHALNPDGSGQQITGTGVVDFCPWLGDGTDTQPTVIGFQPNLNPRVRLSIVLQGTNAIISWPKTCGDLEQTPSLTPPATWSATTNAPVLVGANYQVTVAVAMTNMFYRLQQ